MLSDLVELADDFGVVPGLIVQPALDDIADGFRVNLTRPDTGESYSPR